MNQVRQDLLRSLPSVTALLEEEEVRDWLHGLPRPAVVGALQRAVDMARDGILSGVIHESVDRQEILAKAEMDLLHRSRPSLRRVINATGIVLHTGLGRAPLCEAAIEAIVESVGGYCNLEYDLHTGQRGRRTAHVVEKLIQLTGAESATVVNNNAAATLLILQTFAAGREVIVSRGQLVEIGGSFRLPEILRAGGATLREVGTTNRTRLADYEEAVTDATGLLLRVQPSNYRIVGFTESVAMGEISALAHRFGLLAVEDLGSGLLVNLAAHGLPPEPTVRASLAAGADIVCCSGDKLLGGPQCGLILGKQPLIERLESSPLMRAYRVGKLTLMALEATLGAYLAPETSMSTIPALAMLAASTDALAGRARTVVERLEAAAPGEHFYVCSDVSYAGGGSMPDTGLETVVVQWRPRIATLDSAAAALRDGDVPVIARIHDGAICFDLRTVFESDLDDLVASVSAVIWDLQQSDERGISLPIL